MVGLNPRPLVGPSSPSSKSLSSSSPPPMLCELFPMEAGATVDLLPVLVVGPLLILGLEALPPRGGL
jgi:hypothetical protein